MLSDQEKGYLHAAFDAAAKHSPDTLQAADVLRSLKAKILRLTQLGGEREVELQAAENAQQREVTQAQRAEREKAAKEEASRAANPATQFREDVKQPATNRHRG